MAEPLTSRSSTFSPSAAWRVRQPSLLVSHVVEVHHEPTRAMLAKIERLLGCVTDVYCVRPPMPEIAEYFGRFRQALVGHLEHEEREIFAPIAVLERHVPVTISRAIARATQEHAALHDELTRIRILSGELHAADDTCRAMRALHTALTDLERDLEAHFQLESELLFPRAEELERTVREESRR